MIDITLFLLIIFYLLFLLIAYLYHISIFSFYRNIDALLNSDYIIYKRCVNITNKIACGRTKSKIKKTNKPKQNFRKKYILEECNCTVVTNHLSYKNNKKNMILIGVASGPEYFVERHVYRLMYKKYNFLKVVFFMGASMNHSLNVIINRENSIFNDMIIFSFISSYYNLTSQLICELTWVNEYCRNFNWYIHHTSETYLNVKHIYSFLYKYRKELLTRIYNKKEYGADER